MKYFFKKLFILILLLTPQTTFAETYNPNSNISNEKYYEYFQAVINDKSTIFNSLNLSPEQRCLYEQITTKYSPLYKNALKEILNENKKQNPNKNIIKKLENEIRKLSHNEDADLKSILNRTQKNKYNQIKHLEKLDLKKENRMPNYYKLNPQMLPFGNPKCD